MFSLSSRLATGDNLPPGEDNLGISHQELHTLSLQYINSSLEACTSHAPPLCLLQAITLAGFYKLVNGVYGPAWRLVGAGVRIAYELRLHLIDSKAYEKVPTRDSELMIWSSDEERRRCWWALWEMDIFSSTIQRAPTAIDWSANETFLPVADEYWFTNTYQASCLLIGSPEERWKRLKQSGNENSTAWAHLLGSLMHDGRLLCQESIKGITSNIDLPNDVPRLAQYYSQAYRLKTQGFSDRLYSLVKAYQDVRKNLPSTLAYRDEHLSFALTEGDDPYSTLRTSAGKYSVQMMSASASFMIYQNYVFADIIEGLSPLSSSHAGYEGSGKDSTCNERSLLGKGFRNYLETSDMVLRLLSNCPEDHVRYANPYYASTTWIAAALQVFKRFTLRDHDSTVTQRQYDLLRRSYLQFNQFWDTPSALLQNLDSLEARLDCRHRELDLQHSSARTTRIDDQQCHDDTPSFASTETMMASVSEDQLLPTWSALKGSLCNTSQPSISDPTAGYPVLMPDDVELPSGMGTKFDSSLNQGTFSEAYPDPWPNDLFLDNLVWYSSDVMAGLSHGYTA
ncbi:hypothetical protein AYO21_09742 [Fonsecaea monophora]|uniref:Xylanolytic transcriptional activator regulatory domain-containing protein n=1 Tax=Fonsecaea monophora TaxID=254056 RepID=A0A177EVR3_9EURO|nr:hypothetical protein AYO21_09742 [Fonsecaea monophora]OAG36115.1 hypothetical protein AYO21_09742 [Fonsecaea monophora]